MTESTNCEHKWEDDGDRLQIVCVKCGERVDVDFTITPEEIEEWLSELEFLSKPIKPINK